MAHDPRPGVDSVGRLACGAVSSVMSRITPDVGVTMYWMAVY